MQTFVFTPSINLSNSIEFYQKLKYTKVSDQPVLFTDGRLFVEISDDKFSRPGIKIRKESWQDEILDLKEDYEVFEIPNGYLLRDNNNIWTYLIESKDVDLPVLENQQPGHCGTFMGISVETTSFETSIDYWQRLGFVKVSGEIDQGWIVLANADGFAISFMLPLSSPHSFTNPSMTFFNSGKNEENIQKIREAGIAIKEEITAFSSEGIVDNIIIQDPGGYGMFVFND